MTVPVRGVSGPTAEDVLRQGAEIVLASGGYCLVGLPGGSRAAYVVPDVDLAVALCRTGADAMPPFLRIDFPDDRAVYVCAVDDDGVLLTTPDDVVAYLSDARPSEE